MDNPETPSEDDIRDAINDGENLLKKIKHYIIEASRFDGEIIDSTDDYVPLDELPYGEELLRTKPLLNEVRDAINTLQMIENAEKAAADFEKAQEAIQSAQDTLGDCKSLPESDEK